MAYRTKIYGKCGMAIEQRPIAFHLCNWTPVAHLMLTTKRRGHKCFLLDKKKMRKPHNNFKNIMHKENFDEMSATVIVIWSRKSATTPNTIENHAKTHYYMYIIYDCAHRFLSFSLCNIRLWFICLMHFDHLSYLEHSPEWLGVDLNLIFCTHVRSLEVEVCGGGAWVKNERHSWQNGKIKPNEYFIIIDVIIYLLLLMYYNDCNNNDMFIIFYCTNCNIFPKLKKKLNK